MTGAAHRPTCKLLSALPMEEVKLHLEHLLGERDEEIQRLNLQIDEYRKQHDIMSLECSKALEARDVALRLINEMKADLAEFGGVLLTDSNTRISNRVQKSLDKLAKYTEKRIEGGQNE